MGFNQKSSLAHSRLYLKKMMVTGIGPVLFSILNKLAILRKLLLWEWEEIDQEIDQEAGRCGLYLLRPIIL